MNRLVVILRKLVSALGFRLIRINPERRRDITNEVDWNRILQRTEAVNVNRSVGKSIDNPAFSYFERPLKSSLTMDEAENIWWDKAGDLIEKVWVLPDEINYSLRSEYILKAKCFFLNDNHEARILDLGCGSGWMGRILADHNVQYTGVDFSATQINIAKNKMRGHKFEDKMQFYCTDDFTDIPNLAEINCIAINAFLHHLYWEELGKLFDALKDHFRGCKIFILEPVYFDDFNFPRSNHLERFVIDRVANQTSSLLSDVKRRLVEMNVYDMETEFQLDKLIEESGENGFFLSPKEVPFRLSEFRIFLNQYLTIERFYSTGVFNLEAAQILAKVKDENLQSDLLGGFMSYIKGVDVLLNASSYPALHADQYFFTAFECRLKN